MAKIMDFRDGSTQASEDTHHFIFDGSTDVLEIKTDSQTVKLIVAGGEDTVNLVSYDHLPTLIKALQYIQDEFATPKAR